MALLATAQVRIKVGPLTSGPIRALCYSGAQINLITASVVQAEELPTQQCNMRIIGVNGISRKPFTKKLVCQLLPRFNDESVAEIELLIRPKLTINRLPHSPVPMKMIPDECQTELADPNFGTPAPVDMLLGAGVWAAILQDGSQMNNFGIAIQSSQLEWLVYGGGVLPRTSRGSFNCMRLRRRATGYVVAAILGD